MIKRCKRYVARVVMVVFVSVAIPVMAHHVRVPESGTPAITADIPDGWVVAQKHPGMLNVANHIPADVVVSLNVLKEPRNPTRFVTEEMQGAGGVVPTRKESIEIAGHKGWRFEAIQTSHGLQIVTNHYIARLDAKYLIAVAVLLPSDAEGKYGHLVKQILASVKLAD